MSNTEPDLEHKSIPVETDSGKHSIHVIRHGLSPSSPQPTVIFVSGLGSDCIGFCTVIRRLAAAGIPCLAYDRPGNGRSWTEPLDEDSSPSSIGSQAQPRFATEIAKDMESILSAAGASPPYVLAAHSYGGIISREFLHNRPQDVLGLVLIDANCQNAADRKIDVEALETLLSTGKVDYHELTSLNANHKLRAEEWAENTGKKDPPSPFKKGEGGAQVEKLGYKESCRGLARLNQYEKHVLGKKPVSVLRGNTEVEIGKILNEADRNHAGSDEERQYLRTGLKGGDQEEARIQRDQLRLAEDGAGRLVDVRDAGHNIQLTHPELVANEIKWVLAEIDNRGILEQWKAGKS